LLAGPRFLMMSVQLLAALLLLLQTAAAPDKNSILASLRASRYEEARTLLQQALQQSPGDAALWTLDGFARSHLGQTNDALASYRHALTLSPDYLPALEGAAQIEYRSSGQSAVPLLEKIVALRPQDETSHAMLATLAFERHDCQTAAAEFERSPNLIASNRSSLEKYGSCLVQLRAPERALPVFARLSALAPQDEQARYRLALVQVMAKGYQDAIATLQPVISKRPQDGDALDVLAQAYEGLLDTPRAVATLRQAIVSNPKAPQYYLDFADICLVHAAYRVGIDMLTAGLNRLPASAPLYLARGILYVQAGDFENARNDFEKSSQLDPQLEYGRGLEGLADLQGNRLPQAEADVRSRLRASPKDPFLWYLLAETLTRQGADPGTPPFREAVSAAEKAVALRPAFPVARNILAKLYLAEGNTAGAIDESRLAFQQDPTGESAQTAIYHWILALRKTGDHEQLARLANQLLGLREQARAKETAERRYSLVEVNPSEPGKK
jgi:tetratricopeptide (TPR) repeat protein